MPVDVAEVFRTSGAMCYARVTVCGRVDDRRRGIRMRKVRDVKQTAAAEWVGIDELVPWERNPRVNDHAVADVAKSIERFGWGAVIVARKSDNVVIAGHTRLKAAKSLGMDKVPVRWLDLDPAEAAALALADNKLGEIAAWEHETLREVLQALEAESVDLAGLGFSDGELSALLGGPDLSGGEGAEELSEADFETFDHTCPRCGFEYDGE